VKRGARHADYPINRPCPAGAASETFDVGSPVSREYFDPRPPRFEGDVTPVDGTLKYQNGGIGMSGDFAHATKQPLGSSPLVASAHPIARTNVKSSAPVTGRSQAQVVFLWVVFLATTIVILFAWGTGATPAKRVERMPSGWGMGLRVIELPGGARLEAPGGGFIDSLVGALTTHEAENDGPFIFDGIDYMPGSATRTAPSGARLDQLAAVLNAFPGARISVEGHTDNVGDAGANTKLSAQRAATVKAELVAMGVSAERLTTVGYGPSRPIAGNGSEEGRARNRRMQVTIIRR
jgi:hypothetical protein